MSIIIVHFYRLMDSNIILLTLVRYAEPTSCKKRLWVSISQSTKTHHVSQVNGLMLHCMLSFNNRWAMRTWSDVPVVYRATMSSNMSGKTKCAVWALVCSHIDSGAWPLGQVICMHKQIHQIASYCD